MKKRPREPVSRDRRDPDRTLVIDLLRARRRRAPERSRFEQRVLEDAEWTSGGRPMARWEVHVPAVGELLPGSLHVPSEPKGLVIFALGSGSGRQSPRNRAVARRLNQLGFATLLFDLLTESEAVERGNAFDVKLLARRLFHATRWAEHVPQVRGLPIGYFGASTGSAAALRTASQIPGRVAAVVSYGGRPDLVGDALSDVVAPTLLVVGGDDWNLLELNDEAATLLGGPNELELIPGAGDLPEQHGALEQVARLAGRWFSRYLRDGRPVESRDRSTA